jgi:2-keto-4-pentenoate hydratase/2-oxohepta-3-ene-1,7-dioic acid hydratase in catechol pathway
MRFVRFSAEGTSFTGVEREGHVLYIPDPTVPEAIARRERDPAAFERDLGTAPRFPMAKVRLLAPVARPQKILAIGLNYADHIAESGMQTPEHQVWFSKMPNCVAGPGDAIEVPAVSALTDWEAELVLVIGKTCRHVPADRAHEVVAGVTCGNDVSVRDWQWKTPQWMLGKSFDTHGPIGPCVVTLDEWNWDRGHAIACRVNGETKQQSRTDRLVFGARQQIAHLTQAMTLEPGDLIFTGTPGGVGAALKPPQWLKAGDRCEIEIEGIGVLSNPVTSEPPARQDGAWRAPL